MKIQGILRLVGLLFWGVIASGCGNVLKTPYPAKTYFLIDAGQPVESSAASDRLPIHKFAAGVLKVRQFRVAAPYDGSVFVYKIGPNQYSSDYYAAFLMSSDKMLSDGMCQWLSRSNLFTLVVDAESSVRAHYTLEGSVNAFYADFTDPRHPRAVLQAQFYLLSDEDSRPEILFAQFYVTSAPVTAAGPAGLVDAWNRAYRTMLENLTVDLGRKAPVATQASALGNANTSRPD
jgi:cholesterol transport system auxiliary component